MSPYPSGSHQGVSIHTVALQEPCQSKSGFHQKCIHPYCDPTRRLSIPTGAQPETYPSLSGSYQWRIHPNWGPTRSCTHAHRDPTRAASIPGGPRQWRRQPHRGLNRSVPIPIRILLRVQSHRGPTRFASTHTAIIQEAGLAAWGPTRRLYIPTGGHTSGASTPKGGLATRACILILPMRSHASGASTPHGGLATRAYILILPVRTDTWSYPARVPSAGACVPIFGFARNASMPIAAVPDVHPPL